MRILLTNDDGYSSEGIGVLYAALSERNEVTVSAPLIEQSGVGHAFTFNGPLTYIEIPSEAGLKGFGVSGTPSDAVKFALGHLLPDLPDIVVSGLNIGENSGISSIYSGTVAAAREGAFWGVRSFAFSVCEKGRPFAAGYAAMVPAIIDSVVALSSNNRDTARNRTFFNVNFPPCDPAKCKGIRITRQSLAFFDDRYRREHRDGSDCYWVYGEKVGVEPTNEYDSRAILNNHIAITPLHFDATDDAAIVLLKRLES